MKRRSLFDHLALQRLCEHDPPCGEKDLKQPRLARAGVFFYALICVSLDILSTERCANKTFARKSVFLEYAPCKSYVKC